MIADEGTQSRAARLRAARYIKRKETLVERNDLTVQPGGAELG
jgi:hypothetical protein